MKTHTYAAVFSAGIVVTVLASIAAVSSTLETQKPVTRTQPTATVEVASNQIDLRGQYQQEQAVEKNDERTCHLMKEGVTYTSDYYQEWRKGRTSTKGFFIDSKKQVWGVSGTHRWCNYWLVGVLGEATTVTLRTDAGNTVGTKVLREWRYEGTELVSYTKKGKENTYRRSYKPFELAGRNSNENRVHMMCKYRTPGRIGSPELYANQVKQCIAQEEKEGYYHIR